MRPGSRTPVTSVASHPGPRGWSRRMGAQPEKGAARKRASATARGSCGLGLPWLRRVVRFSDAARSLGRPHRSLLPRSHAAVSLSASRSPTGSSESARAGWRARIALHTSRRLGEARAAGLSAARRVSWERCSGRGAQAPRGTRISMYSRPTLAGRKDRILIGVCPGFATSGRVGKSKPHDQDRRRRRAPSSSGRRRAARPWKLDTVHVAGAELGAASAPDRRR
jgi:hypothetical protein